MTILRGPRGVNIPWSVMKFKIDAGVAFSYVTTEEDTYFIYYEDRSITIYTEIAIESPASVDQSDFENNYLPLASEKVVPRVYDKNSNNDYVVNVVTTTAKNPDPSDISLDSTSVSSGSGSGDLVGNLSTTDGNSPYTYSITNDPDSKFQISGSELQLSATVDYSVSQSHEVTIEVTDKLERTFSKNFTIDVLQFSSTTKVSFNGVDEAIDGGDIANFRTTISISGWIDFPTSGNSGSILSRFDFGSDNQVYHLLLRSDDTIQWQVSKSGSGTENIATTTTLSASTRYHFVVTYDSSTGDMEIYLNGSSDASRSIAAGQLFDTSSVSFKLGARNNTSTGFFEGNLDEVAVYDKVLSSSEVSEIYNSGTPANLEMLSSSSNLKHWFRSENSDSNGLKDVITGNYGTFENMTTSNFVSI